MSETIAPPVLVGTPVRRRTLVIAGGGKPVEAELRRRVAADEMPDVVSAEDTIGATIVDDRYFASMPGVRGRILRRLPLVAAQTVEAFLSGRRFDAILTWGDLPSIAVGLALRLRRRRPPHAVILLWPSRTKKAILLRFARSGIDRYIVWPPLQRRFVEERLKVSASKFIDARAPADMRFWRPMDGVGDMICSVGQEMRDYGTLLEALRPLDINCHIAAGTGLFDTRFLDREWRENVGEQLMPANVTLGRKNHTELRELYARSRFIVVPLQPSDNDSGITVILEAFAMGKPVICTETPGQTGLLEHGVNCLRVPPADPEALRQAIIKLWNDPECCRRLGAAARRAVEEHHGLDAWTTTLVRAVDGAVSDRAPRAATARAPALDD